MYVIRISLIVWIILWLVAIIAGIKIGIIARRLKRRIGILQGWIVPGVAIISFILARILPIGDLGHTFQSVVICLVAIILTVGFVLIWKEIQKQIK